MSEWDIDLMHLASFTLTWPNPIISKSVTSRKQENRRKAFFFPQQVMKRFKVCYSVFISAPVQLLRLALSVKLPIINSISTDDPVHLFFTCHRESRAYFRLAIFQLWVKHWSLFHLSFFFTSLLFVNLCHL